MSFAPEYVAGTTTHARRGAIQNRFSYNVDFVLIDPEANETGPRLFSRNARNLAAVHDIDHGGLLGQGRGAAWARQIFASYGIIAPSLRLLTQPRFVGFTFNPVSFWLAMKDGALVGVISEVSTPFGDRHSYISHLPDLGPITKTDRLSATKLLHVSPFQDVAGDYAFRFDVTPAQITIQILHTNAAEGVFAALEGPRTPLTNRAIIRAALRRPFGGLRTLALIYWQALKLRLKGAKYRNRPTPPKTEVS